MVSSFEGVRCSSDFSGDVCRFLGLERDVFVGVKVCAGVRRVVGSWSLGALFLSYVVVVSDSCYVFVASSFSALEFFVVLRRWRFFCR